MKLSIVTINFNNAEGLRKTMQSVIGQSYRGYEYIVIDGGSTDASLDVIDRHKECLTYWCSEPDSGIYNAMNKGIRKATGDYMLFLNSGDYLHDDTVLEEAMPLLEGTDIVYGDLLFMGADGKGKVFHYPDVLVADYFVERSLGHPATFIKRKLFGNFYPYDESYKIVADWVFFTEQLVLEEASYKHWSRTVSVFDTTGVSSQFPNVCREEIERGLGITFSPMVLSSLQEIAEMRKSPLYDVFRELNRTRRFQRRIKPLLVFLLKLNRCFSRKRSK